MISDLDQLMDDAGLAAIIVPMHEHVDPSFRWLSRSAKVTRGFALHPRGGETLLVHDPMERDEAEAVGLHCRCLDDLGRDEILQRATSSAEAWAEIYERALSDMNVEGPIAFFGRVPVHLYDGVLTLLRTRGRVIPGEGMDDLIQLARKRKEAREIELVEDVGRRTLEIVAEVRRMLRETSIRNGELWSDERPLRLGELKRIVSAEIARLGLVEDHETILSQGRDAGVPHSRGDADAIVRASEPIVLDIFPLDKESGYFFDFTRTFCVGEVSSRLREIHRDVAEAFDLAVDELAAGSPAPSHHDRVCDFFESRGYPTRRSTPGTDCGYVHGLGHGVGLEVHERPSFARSGAKYDTIEVGDILTIEPGLYFPDESIGVRIEETFVIEADGKPRTLGTMDRELEP